MIRILLSLSFLYFAAMGYSDDAAAQPAAAPTADYAIVVSPSTAAAQGWSEVVATLRNKHDAVVLEANSLLEAGPALRQIFPRYVCFVATPDETTPQFVADAHRLTRRFDDDSYTDCLWGIVTGYDAANALMIARDREPLVVHKVASGTEVALDRCEEGVWYCELQQGRMVRKRSGGEAVQERGPDDTTVALVKSLNDERADLFITSGHATERDWQIGFRYRNGSFICRDGRIIGRDTRGVETVVDSTNPKVYLPIGNCLMGHIDSRDAMAAAFMNSAGVRQMIGYTVPTWYGYAGWGMLDYFVEQPGRYTLAEAFFSNQQALLHKLETEHPELARVDVPPGQTKGGYSDAGGLLHDRDVLAFYGDPAWEARMAKGPLNFTQELTRDGDVFTLTVTPQVGKRSFAPVNTNGSQRGGRPIIQLLPRRVRDIKLIDGTEYNPIITDDFILVPLPAADSDASIVIRFSALTMGE
ncbi:MAG: hypothetical protein R3B90_14330 [Planctomycetaceae bacterium]